MTAAVAKKGDKKRRRGSKSKKRPKKEQQARPALRRKVVWAIPLTLLVAWITFELATWPDVDTLAKKAPKSTAFIDARKAALEAEGKKPVVRQTWRSYEQISPELKHAILVSEDINFFSHDGFEPEEMKAAIKNAIEEGGAPRGASTLTQQLAKNLWLSPSRNPLRKLKEAILTRQLESHLSKRRILEIYLNVAELGPNLYGAEAAAQHYFSKSASELTRQEAAQLAAVLPRPRSWHPGRKSEAYERKVETIIRRMEKTAWIRDHL